MASAKELFDKCCVWQDGDDIGFAQIVSMFIQLPMSKRKFADRFEAAVSTIDRWANGIARPRSRMQREIVNWIEQQVPIESRQ